MDRAITNINAALAELVALHEPDFLSKLYAAIDEEISLRDAIAISYVVDSPEDPLAEEALCVCAAARALPRLPSLTRARPQVVLQLLLLQPLHPQDPLLLLHRQEVRRAPRRAAAFP